MRKNILKFCFFLLGHLFLVEMSGQTTDSVPRSRLGRTDLRSIRLSDSTEIDPPILSEVVDSLKPKKTFQLKINSDALDAAVEYAAEDSMFFDLKNKQLHLWGKATMKYTSIDLAADYIVLDYGKSEVTALQRLDSVTLRKLGNKPQFKDGDQDFTATQLKYNFKSQKGIVYEARTLQEQLYVVGEKAKFLSQKTSDTSSLTTIYNKDAILTTCDADHPHYGIKATKLKVVPDKLIVVGPSNLQIAGIPTPLVLPFGFFPISKTRKQGLLLPRDFDYDPVRGLGFQNIGYYLPINDHMDATVFVEWYLRGTWGARTDWKYNYKYKYSGSANLGYRDNVGENSRAEKTHARSWNLGWSHTQDSRAHPTRNFGGSVNIQTNGFQRRNQNDYASVHQNTLSSNLNFRKIFPGKPYQFAASMSHAQNTSTREMTINLPTVDFQMNRIYPFKKKARIGKEKWFEKTSLVYNSRLANEFRTRDDSLTAPGGFKRAWETKKFGIEHRASSDVQLDVLKYFKFSPNINYTEAWYLNKIEKTFDPTPVFVPREDGILVDPISGDTFPKFKNDTLNYGQVKKRTIQGFTPYREFSMGAGLNTVLFGTKQFKKGFLRGIRHKIVPSIGFSYVPYLGGNYVDSVQTDTRPNRTLKQKYTILEDQNFLRPSTSGKTSSSLNFNLGNTLEAKYWSKKDSATRKIIILRSLNFAGSYNLTADSLNWSQISTGANFPIFKNLSNLNIGVAFDPYITENNRRVNKFAYQYRGKLLTMPRLTASLNTAMTVKQVRNILKGRQNDPQIAASSSENTVISDDFWGIFDNFNISHSFGGERRLLQNGRDTFLINQNSLDTRGNVQLTSKWAVNVGHIGYDFVSKRISYPDFGFTRDMHCWQMSFSWQPTRGTYNFFLSVKPGSVLDFLKVPFKKTYPDPRVF